MRSVANVLMVSGLLLVGACASQRVSSSEVRARVSVESPGLLVVRGYALRHLPGLVESMLSERLSGPAASSSPASGEVEIRLRTGTYVTPSNLSLPDVEGTRRNIMSLPDRGERGTVMWFGIDYVVRNTRTGLVTRGFLPAYGPEPESFRSIELNERAVAAGAAARLEKRVHQLLGSS